MNVCLSREQLRYYLDREVDARRENEMKNHLESCAVCRTRIQSLRVEHARVAALFTPVEASEAFEDELRQLFQKVEEFRLKEQRKAQRNALFLRFRESGFVQLLAFRDVRIVLLLAVAAMVGVSLLKK